MSDGGGGGSGSDKPAAIDRTWSLLRFSIVGSLLASPPSRGETKAAIRALAARSWRHPVTGEAIRFGVSTIERWYYAARAERKDPVKVLARRVRGDRGKRRRLSDKAAAVLRAQYRDHESWSYKLHADNLRTRIEHDKDLGPFKPSDATVRRFLKTSGLFRKPRRRYRGVKDTTTGEIAAETRFETREVRSFEAEYVGSLFHLDFHHGSLPVLVDGGRKWVRPIAIGHLDDRSRLCCHAQWYEGETAEDLVHGLSQAIQKRGLSRSILMDNGSAMVAAETREGLFRLGIVLESTLPYSPYQNGKQEAFWGPLEGRLLAMLENKKDLTLDFLNVATQAWYELDYNRAVHSETGETPLERFMKGPDVLRESPSSEDLRLAFRMDVKRTQRRSDGTVSLENVRFEIPSRLRHLERVVIRYARWNLGLVHVVDERTGELLARIFPVDKLRNADGVRREVDPIESGTSAGLARFDAAEEEIAPLLRDLLARYAATGAPPGYLPKRESPPDTDADINKEESRRP